MTERRAAVLGSPIAHSLSPVLHTAGYAACGLGQWRYDAHEVTTDGFADFVGALGEEWRGLSLTMPLKEVAVEVAATVTPVAARARAINTLVRRPDGGWDATNTDVTGIVEALRPHLPEIPAVATVIGAGATARSAVLALGDLGVSALVVRARREEAAAELADFAVEQAGFAGATPAPIGPLAPHERLVVSTVPAAAAADIAASLGPAQGAVLLDVVYANWPTPIAARAGELGWTVVSGLAMLVHQAAAQFELFTGRAAPVEAMWSAGLAALGRDR